MKAALRKQGFTLKALSLANGFSESAVRRVIGNGRAASVQAVIAAALSKRPQDIWPSRYNADGTPRRRNQRRADDAAAQRSIREAA